VGLIETPHIGEFRVMKSVFAFVLLVSSYAFAQSVTEPASEAVTAPVVTTAPAPTPEPVATPEATVVAKVSEPKAKKPSRILA
jgi:hypothetical protein